MRYRRDEHDDLPDTSAFNNEVVNRRHREQEAREREIAKENVRLLRKETLPLEVENLLENDFDAYCSLGVNNVTWVKGSK